MSQLLHLYRLVRPHRRQFVVSATTKDSRYPEVFWLYEFTSRMGTDAVLTALSFHRYVEVRWDKTTVTDRFVSHELPAGEA